MQIPEQKPYYPFVTRTILRLIERGLLTTVTAVDIEPNYGYITRLSYSDGTYRITNGNDVGVNSGAAIDLAQDKGYTKFMLRKMGVRCPDGEEFLLPWWYEKIHRAQEAKGHAAIRTVDQTLSYVHKTLGYPVYIKPVDGLKGNDIFKVYDRSELRSIIELYNEKKIRLAVVEAPIDMPDYRIVIFDGKLVTAYERIPLTVIGDGESTIRALISKRQFEYESQGRDTRIYPTDKRIISHLHHQDLTLDDVLVAGQSVVVVPISNLSVGGTSRDVTDSISDQWVRLAVQIAKNLNLRLIGLDIACADITAPDAAYSVFEVNGTPGFDLLASAGESELQLIEDFYATVFNSFPHNEP